MVNGKEEVPLKFGVPMIWRELRNHHDNLYFYFNMKAINRNNKQKWTYRPRFSKEASTAFWRNTHSNILHTFPENDKETLTSADVQFLQSDNDSDLGNPERFNQQELNDVVKGPEPIQGGFWITCFQNERFFVTI